MPDFSPVLYDRVLSSGLEECQISSAASITIIMRAHALFRCCERPFAVVAQYAIPWPYTGQEELAYINEK
jgi:hypothetical protein